MTLDEFVEAKRILDANKLNGFAWYGGYPLTPEQESVRKEQNEKVLASFRNRKLAYRIYPEDVEDFAYKAKDLILQIVNGREINGELYSELLGLLEDWPGEL